MCIKLIWNPGMWIIIPRKSNGKKVCPAAHICSGLMHASSSDLQGWNHAQRAQSKWFSKTCKSPSHYENKQNPIIFTRKKRINFICHSFTYCPKPLLHEILSNMHVNEIFIITCSMSIQDSGFSISGCSSSIWSWEKWLLVVGSGTKKWYTP